MKKARVDVCEETIFSPLDVTEEELHICDDLYGADTVPKGFRNKDDWMAIWKLRPRSTHDRLVLLEKMGRLEKRQFSCRDSLGKRARRPFWKMIRK